MKCLVELIRLILLNIDTLKVMFVKIVWSCLVLLHDVNDSYDECMHQVLMCKDYVLIKGYPGTGDFQHNHSYMLSFFLLLRIVSDVVIA